MYQTVIQHKIRTLRLLHAVSLELTYQCDLNCFYCYNNRQKKGTLLTLDEYRVLLRDLAEMQTLFLMLTGGEPMCHPHFFKIGRMSRDLGFVVRIRTNGHALDTAAAKQIQREIEPYSIEVSLHGATAEVHDRQTRVTGSFDRLLKNIKQARDIGLRCEFVTTPTAWNEHQIEEMFTLCDALETPLRFQGPVGPRDNGDITPLTIQPAEKTWNLITALQAERRSHQGEPSVPFCREPETGNPVEDREEPAMCSVGVSGVDIDPFGNVQACMHLQKSAGSLHEQSIGHIWENSPLFQRARARAIEAAQQFSDKPPRQYGAPLFCIAVAENSEKHASRQCINLRR